MLIQRFVFSACFLFFLLFSLQSFGQKSQRDSTIAFFTASFNYLGQLPAGDFAQRYNYTNMVGIEFGYKFRKGFFINTGGYFVFGEKVKSDDILKPLTFSQDWQNSDGTTYNISGLIDGNGYLTGVGFGLRGFAVPLKIGKIFHKVRFGKRSPNSGLFIEIGAQFIQHQIYMDVPSDKMPFLSGEYRKGYDRLTNGVGGLASVGYKYFGPSRGLNFIFALNFSYHFTHNRRGFNYDTGVADTGVKHDILYGFQVGWVLPMYKIAPNKFYYY